MVASEEEKKGQVTIQEGVHESMLQDVIDELKSGKTVEEVRNA